MKLLVYSYVSPGYDEKVDDGRLYIEPPAEISERFNNTRMIARMAKALPHLFLEHNSVDACLWLDSNIRFVEGYSAEKLVKEYFADTEHCGVFAHTKRTEISQEIEACNKLNKDHPSLTAKHTARRGRLAWTGILYRTFSRKVIRANNRWWAEISTKSSRDQLSFPYSFKNLVDYKINPDLNELGEICYRNNSKWKLSWHLKNQNF